MQISFHGAAREVTGSCYLLETKKARVIVDCGMFQGSAFADAKNFKDFAFNPSNIDAVILTHAHLDHCGRIPKLFREGFRGNVYCTGPSARLAKLILEDAEQIMDEDYQRQARPKLFERVDVDQTCKHFLTIEYEHAVNIGDLTFKFREAGHILGSAFVEIEEKGGPRVALSGDLGNVPDPILKPTAQLAAQDVLIIESTYGNRLHEDINQRDDRLQYVIENTIKENGVLIIPAFAIERTQELLFELNHLVENKLIPPVDIYLDSPLAIRASEVFQEFPQYYNKEAFNLVSSGDDLFTFPRLSKTMSRDESKQINEAKRPKIIISGSGMMNAGRIQHHLIRYLGDIRSTVLIIGYQAYGTLGRRLYTGEKHVEVLGERIDVRARVVSIGAYSAHADQKQLLNWVKSAQKPPGHIYCTHGEEAAAAALASRITEDFQIPADVPRFEQKIQI